MSAFLQHASMPLSKPPKLEVKDSASSWSTKVTCSPRLETALGATALTQSGAWENM